MNPDDFEKQLQQPMRQIPADWRAEILRNAKASEAPRASAPALTLGEWLREVFHVNPRVWAGLAAVWAVILVLNHSSSLGTPTRYAQAGTTGPGLMASLQEQQRVMAELIRSAEPLEANRPRNFQPTPRSDSTYGRLRIV